MIKLKGWKEFQTWGSQHIHGGMALDRISEQNLIAIVAVTPNKLNIGREIPGFEVITIQREAAPEGSYFQRAAVPKGSRTGGKATHLGRIARR